ncbi:MAG: hypothetical protein RLZZ15_3563 [Verrucomicrobiota bacterium]|jgi:LysM repeat protein
MRRLRVTPVPALAALVLLAFSGCGYVHVGRLPAPVTTVVGDEKLLRENSELRSEKKLLQQELALTRAQGDALRFALENRAADGDTSRRLTEKLTETSRELAALRASHAKLQAEFAAGPAATAAELAALRAKLGTTEQQLASSLRNYTDLQSEITRLRTAVDEKRAENAVLAEQVKTVTAQSAEAQAALAQLNLDLLSQKDARARAEQDTVTLRTQLQEANGKITVLAQQRTAPAPGATGLAAGPTESGDARTQLDALRKKVWALEAERAQLQQQLGENPSAPGAKKPGDPAPSAPNAKEIQEENAALVAANTDLANARSALETDLARARANVTSLTEENARLKARLPSPAPQAGRTPGGGVTATFITSTGTGAGTAPAGAPPPAGRTHVVAAGDTLSKISTLYYGSPARWQEILHANRDVLGEDNNLVIGRTLRIPQ